MKLFWNIIGKLGILSKSAKKQNEEIEKLYPNAVEPKKKTK